MNSYYGGWPFTWNSQPINWAGMLGDQTMMAGQQPQPPRPGWSQYGVTTQRPQMPRSPFLNQPVQGGPVQQGQQVPMRPPPIRQLGLGGMPGYGMGYANPGASRQMPSYYGAAGMYGRTF